MEAHSRESHRALQGSSNSSRFSSKKPMLGVEKTCNCPGATMQARSSTASLASDGTSISNCKRLNMKGIGVHMTAILRRLECEY